MIDLPRLGTVDRILFEPATGKTTATVFRALKATTRNSRVIVIVPYSNLVEACCDMAYRMARDLGWPYPVEKDENWEGVLKVSGIPNGDELRDFVESVMPVETETGEYPKEDSFVHQDATLEFLPYNQRQKVRGSGAAVFVDPGCLARVAQGS